MRPSSAIMGKITGVHPVVRKEAAQFYRRGRREEKSPKIWRKKKAVFSGAERFVRSWTVRRKTADQDGHQRPSGHQQGTDERDCFYEEDRLPEEMAETIVGGRRIETGMNINLR